MVTLIAVSAFPIYLSHRFVPEALLAPVASTLPAPFFHLLAITGGIGIGIVAGKAWASLRNLLSRSAMGRQPELHSV
ncbi:hypothetical protein [Mesorhizobium sp.]|uniref:hypothetical protein n=1 Tax=Mesorhizobium sp. TaxID=1871066 RepID=UPI0025D99F55|nr:hypothetical protein [Mesorhizobium sp.]